MARIEFMCVTGATVGLGRRSVPSSPESPRGTKCETDCLFFFKKKNKKKKKKKGPGGSGGSFQFTVDVLRVECRPAEWLLVARVDRNVRPANGFENA